MELVILGLVIIVVIAIKRLGVDMSGSQPCSQAARQPRSQATEQAGVVALGMVIIRLLGGLRILLAVIILTLVVVVGARGPD